MSVAETESIEIEDNMEIPKNSKYAIKISDAS